MMSASETEQLVISRQCNERGKPYSRKDAKSHEKFECDRETGKARGTGNQKVNVHSRKGVHIGSAGVLLVGVNLVPRASFPLTSGRKTRALVFRPLVKGNEALGTRLGRGVT